MRLAVEQGTQRNDSGAPAEGQPRPRRHQRAEHERGSQNHRLDEWQPDSAHAEHASERHRSDKRRRQRQQRAPPELHRPKAHRDHREQMIESRERMRESPTNPPTLMSDVAGMRMRQRRRKGEGKNSGMRVNFMRPTYTVRRSLTTRSIERFARRRKIPFVAESKSGHARM
jgi:hypothetical protein